MIIEILTEGSTERLKVKLRTLEMVEEHFLDHRIMTVEDLVKIQNRAEYLNGTCEPAEKRTL